MNSPTTTSETNGWQPVAPGTFTRLARRSAERRGRRRVAVTALAACVALVAVWSSVGVAYLGLQTPDTSGFEYAGIRCGEVRDLLPAYLAGRLPDAKASQVRAHVTKCSICKERIRRIEAGLPIAVARPPVSLPLAPAEAFLARESFLRHPSDR